jgi:hypothetical protein
MKTARATPEQLEAFLIKSGRAFQLQCKYCRDLGTISFNRKAFSDPDASWKAALAFAEQGWWFDGVPICPKCYIRKRSRAIRANR